MASRKKKVITVYYNFECDDTSVIISPEFEDSDSLTKLDVLKDVIGALSVDYGISLEKLRSEFRKD